MPRDRKGNFHLTPHHARMADGMTERKPMGRATDSGIAADNAPEDEHTEGMTPGDDEHGEAISAHLQNMHEMTGDAHTHIRHHPDGTHTVHHISESGEMSGPHSHSNLEALKDHLGKFLDEEETEYTDKQGQHEY